jgi:hypothetical protein
MVTGKGVPGGRKSCEEEDDIGASKGTVIKRLYDAVKVGGAESTSRMGVTEGGSRVVLSDRGDCDQFRGGTTTML